MDKPITLQIILLYSCWPGEQGLEITCSTKAGAELSKANYLNFNQMTI
jgi:hypothetical protein